MKITRKRFLQKTTLVFGAVAVTRTLGASVNDVVRVVIIGMGNKGKSTIKDVFRTPGARLVGVCDVDSSRLDSAVDSISKDYKVDVKKYSDFRRVLDSKDVDAVVVTAPNHWHALISVMACQAGKDVYVEKPVCHSLREGLRMLEAAAKYNRIVQSGLQARSDIGLKEGFQWLREGHLGKVKLLRSIVYDHRSSIGKLATPLVPPTTCNFDLWLGPAEDQPIYRPKLHYDWHWDWNTGNGDSGNQGVHELDLVRWMLDDPDHPESVFSFGGRFAWDDAGNTPNTQISSFNWTGKVPVLFELRDLWMNPATDVATHYKGHRFGIVVSCEGGEFRGGRGGGTVYDEKNNKVRKFDGDGGFDHFPAFIRAVRSRKESDLACTLKQGYLSTCLCHLANISVRTGNPASRNEVISAVSKDGPVSEATNRMLEHLDEWKIDFSKEPWSLGQTLEFSSKKESFTSGRDVKAANQLLKRNYRKGYEFPRAV